MDPRKQAALREAVHELLPRVIPVVREGGRIPLRSIAEPIAGEKVGSDVRRALDARGPLTFSPEKAGRARFENDGQQMDLRLKAIKLKIPKRLSGWAEVLDGEQGVALHFDKRHTLSACKALVCADVEGVELTKRRIFVDLEGKAFDRSFDLGAKEDARGAAAPRGEGKPAADRKVAARTARPSQPAQRKVVEVSAQKEERSTGKAKAPLRGAIRDAKANIRSGVEKTLRSAAESHWAAKQAVHEAGRDAKTNVQSGVRRTRESAAERQKAVKMAARNARESARGQLEHSKETVRSRGPAPRPKEGESRGGGYLGMTTYPVRLPEKLAEERNATGGLIVLEVQPDGPADEAGLQLGDTLLTLGGRPMRKPGDLKQQLSPDHVGQRMDAVVLRAGKARHFTVEVGER